MAEGDLVMKKDRFFRKGESVYIHMSNEVPEYVGVVHKHYYIEIVYIISGEATHVVGDYRLDARKGDLFIIEYDTPHAFLAKKDADEPFLAYDLMFTPDFVDVSMIGHQTFQGLVSSSLFYSLINQDRILKPDLHLHGTSLHDFGELFERMYREYKVCRPGYYLILRAYVIELLVKILRSLDERQHSPAAARQSKYIDNAIEYLRRHYNQNIRLEELAIQSFLSKSYFGRLFKDSVGMSFSEYVQKLRIEEVCKLLRENDENILDIALKCGFNDTKYFYATFRKYTGCTPGAYRKQERRFGA